MTKPKIICFCGSLRFREDFERLEYESLMRGEIALLPCCMHVDIERQHGATSEYKSKADELHLRKIDLADEVFVINKNGYIGESTQKEIDYALYNGKLVRFMEKITNRKMDNGATMSPFSTMYSDGITTYYG